MLPIDSVGCFLLLPNTLQKMEGIVKLSILVHNLFGPISEAAVYRTAWDTLHIILDSISFMICHLYTIMMYANRIIRRSGFKLEIIVVDIASDLCSH